MREKGSGVVMKGEESEQVTQTLPSGQEIEVPRGVALLSFLIFHLISN